MANTAPILILGEGQITYGVPNTTFEATGDGLDPHIVLARFRGTA